MLVYKSYCSSLFPFIILLAAACSSSPTSKRTPGTDDTASYTFQHPGRMTWEFYDFGKSIYQPYVDTLNAFKKSSKLPAFLFDVDLDVKTNINDWPSSNFISLRQEIMLRVTNVDVLEEMLRTPYFKTQFDGIDKRRAKVDSDETTYHWHARYLLQELTNEARMDPIAQEKSKQNLLHQISIRDSVLRIGYFSRRLEVLDSINVQLDKALEDLARTKAYTSFPPGEYGDVSYLVSPDKKLCLVSWDTYMGGMIVDYRTMAIYKGTRGLTRMEALGRFNQKTHKHYNQQEYFTQLYSLTDSNGATTYFAYGQGQSSSVSYWKTLQAFQLNDGLEYDRDSIPAVAEGKNSFGFDVSKMAPDAEIPEIRFSADRRDIQIPEMKNEVPTGRYIKYHFSDGIYSRAE